VLPEPKSFDWNGDGEVSGADAWLELYNASDEALDLSYWRLVITEGDDDAYRIPTRTSLRPGGYLVLYLLQGEMSLAEGSTIQIFNDEGEFVDGIILPEVPADASYSRDSHGTRHDDWPPTPGEPNAPYPPEPAQLPE
jgi:hypothetical protein